MRALPFEQSNANNHKATKNDKIYINVRRENHVDILWQFGKKTTNVNKSMKIHHKNKFIVDYTVSFILQSGPIGTGMICQY
jgi:hypothetical protein